MDFWEFVWGALVVFFFAMFLVIFITTVMDVFRSRDIGGGAKALWLISLVVLPVIGVLIYMIVRGPDMAERSYQTQMANAEAMVAAGVARSARRISSPGPSSCSTAARSTRPNTPSSRPRSWGSRWMPSRARAGRLRISACDAPGWA